MLSYNAAALDELNKVIEENIESLKDVLANRAAVPDYETYCHISGKIAGLRMAGELCDEAARRLDER